MMSLVNISKALAKTRVLLVDDHTIVRQGIRLLLETQGNIKVVGEAADGRQAIEKVKQLTPDVVVLDMETQNPNGIITLYKFKETNPEVKVIIITHRDNEEYIYLILKAGAAGYLLRDLGVVDLISAIKSVMEGNVFLASSITSVIAKSLYKLP